MSTSPIPPILDQDRYAAYQPTAATIDFALGFPLFGEAADIAVYLDGDLLDLTIDYTIRSTANGARLTPAPITDAYVRLNAPIAAGKLEIFGNFRPRRTIQATAPYGTRDFNFAFSLLMAAMREMWAKFTRSLKVPVGEPDLTIPRAEVRAGQVFAFDEAGKPTIGGRYADLMSSASAATVAAANAVSSAQAAAASAEAAATFDPASYSTTSEISALLEGYVPATRTIASGLGVKINAGESATLAGTVTVGLDLATPEETIAGQIGNKPAAPDGVHAAIAAALAGISTGGARIKRIVQIGASGSYTPSAGTTIAFAALQGAGGGGSGGYAGGRSGGGGAGAFGVAAIAVTADVSYPVVVGAAGSPGYGGGWGGGGGTTSITVGGNVYSVSGGGGGHESAGGAGAGGTPSGAFFLSYAGASSTAGGGGGATLRWLGGAVRGYGGSGGGTGVGESWGTAGGTGYVTIVEIGA